MTAPGMQNHLQDNRIIRFLDEQAVAERLGVSVGALRRWRLIGVPPVWRKFGSAVRYAVVDLEAFEQNAIRTSTSDPGPQATTK